MWMGVYAIPPKPCHIVVHALPSRLPLPIEHSSVCRLVLVLSFVFSCNILIYKSNAIDHHFSKHTPGVFIRQKLSEHDIQHSAK